MQDYFIGIDTSNYTTSGAVASFGGGDFSILKNEKKLLEVAEKARGVRQSDAVFQHTKNLPLIFEGLGKTDARAVGVSVKPRDAEGSYMPCFLAGRSAAFAVAQICGIPCYTFSHQAGHIMAALYSCGRTDLASKRFLSFHVSGGTTELLLVEKMTVKKLGGTLDLNAGQLIDRVGVRLGIAFPCGGALEALTEPGQIYSAPSCTCVNGLDCNLSGAENKACELMQKGAASSEIAAFTIACVLRTISKMTENALKEYSGLPIVYAGGVMSNKAINNYITGKYNAFFAAPSFSCDNAAGIAILAGMEYEKKRGIE